MNTGPLTEKAQNVKRPNAVSLIRRKGKAMYQIKNVGPIVGHGRGGFSSGLQVRDGGNTQAGGCLFVVLLHVFATGHA